MILQSFSDFPARSLSPLPEACSLTQEGQQDIETLKIASPDADNVVDVEDATDSVAIAVVEAEKASLAVRVRSDNHGAVRKALRAAVVTFLVAGVATFFAVSGESS